MTFVAIDLDNTLADREGSVRAWIEAFADQHGLSHEDRDWIFELDNDGYSERRSVFEQLQARFNLTEPVETLLHTYQQNIIDLVTPLPGAHDCLAAMREAGIPIVILSNGSAGQQNGKIDHLGLRGLVDAVIISGEIGSKKPAPEIYEAAAIAVGEPLRGAWMVGDAVLHDIVGATKVGMKTAWIRRGRTWTDLDTQGVTPTATIDSLLELLPLLR